MTIQQFRDVEQLRKDKSSLHAKHNMSNCHLERIKSAYQNSEITNRLDKVAELLDRRSDEMGWYFLLS